MARWAKFPVSAGAVNSRPAHALEPGEFTSASGVRYKPDSAQLHPDLAYADFNYRPDDFGTYYGYKGPWHLNFENTDKDWLMLVCNRSVFSDTGPDVRGQILFAPSDGSGGWQLSSYSLTDNKGNQNGLTEASLAHWGDRYYLATDQGCVEIAPPTGTGAPTVTRLGAVTLEQYGMLLLGNSTDNSIGTSLGGANYATALNFSSADPSKSDLISGDLITIFVTEYDSENDEETAPIWVGPSSAGYWRVTANGQYPTITFPADFVNDKSDKFRAYFKYWGPESDVSRDFVFGELYRITRFNQAAVGLSLLTDGEFVEFDAGDTVSFDRITKYYIQNALPVIATDGARQIFPAQRHPSCATAVCVWNDSITLSDSGFDKGDTFYRSSEPINTIVRYSPPGDLINQPVPYFLNFASEREDAIRAIKTVNDRLLVLCDQAVHSVRYLPFNNLLAAQQGRVKDVVSTNVGVVSGRSVAKLETGRGEMCAWLSRRGLEWSDGIAWDDACPDFKVPAGTSEDHLSKAVLVNIPGEYRLDLYLGTKLYSFYYHPSHMKNGRLKMLGPTELGKIITGACEYGGTVYRFDGVDIEWTGAETENAEGIVYTGHVHGDNPFNDVEILDMGVAHSSVDGAIKLRCDAAVTGMALSTGSEVTLNNPELEEVSAAGMAQRGTYVRFRLAVTGSGDWSVGPLWIKGDEESGGNG